VNFILKLKKIKHGILWRMGIIFIYLFYVEFVSIFPFVLWFTAFIP
jgi:hypothetical protein